MRLYILLIFVIFFSTACGPANPPDSGIEGSVTIGPMCPVVQVGNPCPDKPYEATLTVLSSASHGRVLQLRTDAQGTFHETLGPGEFILHPESSGVIPHAADIPFVVTPHQFTHINVTYDSGIR